jgi:ENTH domain
MFSSSFIARGIAALQGSETEQRIAVLLYDDAVQVISSFELNQLASLTYHENNILTSSRHDMIEILLDHLEKIISQPINYSIVSVQKALVVTKHLLLHGAEKIVPHIKQQLVRSVDMLRQYNTVLAAQQQSSSTAWLLRLKGGGVDTAGPVREIAEQICNLLCNMQQLQFERCASADPNSLVPIGDRRQVAFITDEVRLERLRRRMQEEQTIRTRSNLAKASDGFGSGYMAANGKTVVGAAHGIEEMIKQKQKEEQRFSDESKQGKKSYVR